MGTKRMTLVAAVLGTVAAAGMMGCNQGKAKDKGGAASVSVNALSISDVATVTVSVQGGGMGSPLVVPLVKKGTQFSALVSDLPVGTDYAFTASAKDGSAVELYHGGVTAQTIVKNQTANIVIDMNQVAPSVSLYDEAPVIAGLTETASCVSKGDTVTIKATAYDPDAGDTAGMGWNWTVDATCGTLSSPVNVAGTSQASPGTSTVVFTATSSSANCQVNLTIADARQPAVLMTTGSVTISIGDACAFGNAQITAIPNTCPVVVNIGAVVGPVPGDGTPSYVPMVVGQSTFVTVSATDADTADTLLYSWSSPDCAGGTPTTSYGNWNDSTAKAGTWFLLTSAPPSGTCTFLVHVSDGTFADGKAKCDIVNHLSLPVKGANDVVKGNPVFGYDYQSTGTVNDGDTVKLEIVAPTTGCDTAYNLVWNPAGTALTTLDPPFTTGITLTAPTGAGTNGETVTVTATCPSSGLQTVHSFVLIGTSAVCNGATDGTVCTGTAQLTDKCVTLAKCAGGLCVAQTSVTCTPSTTVCQDNVCGHTTDGLCHLQPSSDGTGCSDGLACTTGDKCGAGVCGGTAASCTPTGNPCMVNACTEPNGSCVAAAAPNGTVCDDHNGCTGQSTLPPSTGIANPDTCTAGVCGGAAVTCTGTLVCTSQGDDTHTCDPKVCMAGNYAKKWVPPFSGMGVGTTGTPWAAGQIYNPFDFGSGTVTSSGSADIYLTQLDPATGLATQSFTFGDTGGKDQVASAVAVASSGNVGLIGYFTGEIDFTGSNSDGSGPSGNPGVAGADFLQNSSAIPFYGVFDGASTGAFVTPKLVHMVDVGTGALLSVGSNPGQNAIAICGKTSKAVPNWPTTYIAGTSAATKGVITGGNAVYGTGMDIVVAKIDASTGMVIWGKQFGGAGDQICNAVTIDNNGDVIIGGNYNGTLVLGSTTLPAADSSTAILFAAKLNGTTGAPISAASWGTAGRSNVGSVTVDASNNIIIAGSIGASVDMGGGVSMTWAGLTDAFAAKLTTALAPVWAQAFGDVAYDQTVKSVAVSSSGDVYIGGNFEGSLGALGLTASANTALDAFDAQLSGVDGSPLCAHSYGDASGTQGIATVTVARTATGALANSIMIGGSFSSDMQIGSFDLNTGSPGLSASFIARLTP